MNKIGKTKETMSNVAKWLMLLGLLIFLPLSMSAQVIDEDEDDEEPDEEDEITVVDQSGNEEVIEFPEAMTYDLDSLLNVYMAKTYLDEPQDCNMKDVNPEYSKQEFVDRLYRMPCVMEMAYNDVVQKFIDRYSGRLRRSISYMLGGFELLHAHLRGGVGDVSAAFGTEVSAHHRVSPQPDSRQPCRCRRSLAVYACHWQAIWPEAEFTGR